jgi:hypothetical protein
MSPWNWLKRIEIFGPSSEEVGAEIDDELEFHFQSLVEENLAKGMTFSDAWSAARERFGSLPRYSAACRELHRRSPSGAAAAVALAALTGVVAWNAASMQAWRRTSAEPQTAQVESRIHQSKDRDVAGRLVDSLGRPVANADVLVVLKSWPNGRYRQRAMHVRANGEGEFRLADALPAEGPYAVHLAAFKEGFAFASSYRLVEDENEEAEASKLMRLSFAADATLVVQDEMGRPAPNARVAPQSRKSSHGDSHQVYFQASGPVQRTTDAEGRTPLDCFEPGDRAELFIQLPGRDWIRRTVDVPAKGDVVFVSTKASPSDRP